MAIQQFETTVQKEGTRVFINLPFTPQAAWGQSVRYVKGTLNGVEFHASIAVRHGPCFMPLNKDLQKSASLSVGDTLTVTMEPDEAQVELHAGGIRPGAQRCAGSRPVLRNAHGVPAQYLPQMDHWREES